MQNKRATKKKTDRKQKTQRKTVGSSMHLGERWISRRSRNDSSSSYAACIAFSRRNRPYSPPAFKSSQGSWDRGRRTGTIETEQRFARNVSSEFVAPKRADTERKHVEQNHTGRQRSRCKLENCRYGFLHAHPATCLIKKLLIIRKIINSILTQMFKLNVVQILNVKNSGFFRIACIPQYQSTYIYTNI